MSDKNEECNCDQALALIETVNRLVKERDDLYKALTLIEIVNRNQLVKERDELVKERDEALETAEAAIIADLRGSASLLDGGVVPSSDFATHNRAIASALRKAANRYERGEHRKEKTSDE